VLGIIGLLGVSVYVLSRMGWLGMLDAPTLDKLYIKILLPAMFFCACIANNHLVDHVGLDVAMLYGELLIFFYAAVYLGMWCIESLRSQSAQYAMQICSNHLMMVAAPLAAILFGIDAIPVIILGMLVQLALLIISIILEPDYRKHALEVISRYYQQSLPVWCAIVMGLLASCLPWKEDIMIFFMESFEWLSLFNVLFVSLVMATKSLSIKHSLQESSFLFVGKLLCIIAVLTVLQTRNIVDEVSLVLLSIMLVAPGIMIRDYASIHEHDSSIYWKQIIAGCNIWYMITLVIAAVLPSLWG